MCDEDKYYFLEGKSASWVYTVPKEEIVKFLGNFKLVVVLRILHIDELRRAVAFTDEKEQVKTASKENLIQILSKYQAKAIYETLKLDELRRVSKSLIETTLELQEKEEKAKQESIQKVIVINENTDEMANNEELKLQVFDGKNYSIWKKRILMYLKWKKCDEPATRRKLDSEDHAAWDEKDLKAMNYIYCSVSNDQLEFVSEQNTAYDILKKYDNMYIKESSALQICIRNKLDKMKLKDFDDSSSFFTEFEKTINELKNAGGKVDEREKLNYMLRTLPDSLSYIGDLIDALNESDRNCEFLKNKISMWESRNTNNENGKKKTSVFQVEQNKDKNCFECGKFGHFKKDCRNIRTRGRGTRGGAHWQGGARNPQAQQQQQTQHFRGRGRRGGQRGYYSRGRGGQQHGDGSRQYDARYSENVSDQIATDAFITEVNRDDECDVKMYACDTNKIEWILDSGCSDHIVNDESYFCESITLEKPINVKVGDGRILKGTKIGKIMTYFNANETSNRIAISNVFYVKEMDKNLLSFAKVTDKNKIISVENTSKIFNGQNKLIAVAYKKHGLYKISSFIDRKECYITDTNEVNFTQKERYHRMLGHVNFKYLENMCKNKLVDGMPEKLEPVFLKCGTCIQNKMHNLPFENNRTKANDILEIVHTDLNGPHKTIGFDGSQYFLTFIDDYSKCTLIYTIKSKSEVCECFIDYINKVENMTGKRIKRLRCDNGKEYLNRDVYDVIRDKGIFLEPCPPYIHELNGTAERYNRTIMDSARCLLYEAKVNRKFWPEVVKAACYLKNRTIANTIENKTPFEIFFKRRPDISHLRLYGSKVFVRVPEIKRNTKWDRKADVGILLGYDHVGYRILINNKIVRSRHVDIIENDKNLIGFQGNENSDDDVEDNNFEKFKNTFNERQNSISNESDETVELNEKCLRRSERERKKPDRYNANFVNSNYIYVNVVSADSPSTYEEAINSGENDLWNEAMNKEMNCLRKNKTWKLVERPKNKKILDLKWVFTNKSDNRKKARLVVRGFQQTEILEDLYSPVARIQTLKLLLSYCCQHGLKIMQMDVETAFLNGYVKSEVFVKQPKGYDDGTNKVYKLEKALYGLRESPRAWYECFDNYIENLKFQRSESDYCLYMKYEKDDIIYLILFVDDLLICGKNIKSIDQVKIELSNKFAMKDLGEVNTYLGINIKYNCAKGEMTLDQTDYIGSLANKYNIADAKLYCTPMEQNLSLEPAQSASTDLKYRNLIGALLYISTGTRLDVSYSVNYLSRFQNSYDETHYKYALRILKYLYLTKNLKLTYTRNLNAEAMECFVDADWAGDKNDRKSTTGYVIKIFGNVVYWKSKKQSSVTKSSTAAEYVALSELVSEVKVIKNLLKDFKVNIEKPINIFEDNSGAIAIAKFGNLTKNSKYIEIHYHFVNECYEKGTIKIIKVDSENNIADILTKALGRNKFEKFRKTLRIVA